MKPRWLKGLDEQSAKELTQDFMQARLMRERLTQMLEEDIQVSLTRMRNYARGSTPNLSEAYADELARQKVIIDIQKLIR